MGGPAALPPEAWVTALAALDGMGPARLRALLAQHPEPEVAWATVRSGRLRPGPALAAALGPRPGPVTDGWVAQTGRADPEQRWQAHAQAGVGVVLAGHPSYPEAFVGDPEPPPILFHLGDPDQAVGARVAIVGTRDCTRYGHDVAFELGRDLSALGVGVVSGLALGIDGSAHAGALEARGAPPVAVVGSGLDRPYPRRHRPLWNEVARRGVIWSEYPLGTSALAWHFPARNRLIAALADVLVVVESHGHGGALLTVEEASARSRPVMAVPGPVHSPASAGTNQLLAESPPVAVARDVTDVLVALGLETGSRRQATERRPSPTDDDAEVLAALGWQPATLEQLADRLQLATEVTAARLMRLELDGWVAARGGWYERQARSGG